MGLKFSTGDPRRDRILGEISDMKYHDLKQNCILRGIDFDLMLSMDFPRLSSWLEKHWDLKKDQKHLKEFDDFMDLKLKERGYKKKHPMRQYRQMTGNEPPEQPDKPVKEPKVVKPKVKKEKDTRYNIFKGTKKELVYQLSQKLFDQLGKKYENKELVKKFCNQVMEKVQKKFKDGANEKSVRIWMKRALDTIRK